MPVARAASTARRIAFSCALVDIVPGSQDAAVGAFMALRRTHVADASVPVIMDVPVHELERPLPSGAEIGEARRRELRAVLCRAGQGSTKALSSLTREREDDGFTPSHYSIASTFVALSVAPLPPCSPAQGSAEIGRVLSFQCTYAYSCEFSSENRETISFAKLTA